ncbi:SWIM zinc finger family protein [Candidatus Dependentiae bacterium]|nr:SWIM zinc finger family protein [Candidatus Dependentiae bacterium]
MDKISLKMIKESCIDKIYYRGLDYYASGYVKNLKVQDNNITANVSGTRNYKVKITIDKGKIKANCECPYDWGGFCKHIIAVLLDVAENCSTLKKDEEQQSDFINEILSKITLAELKDFLLDELDKNPTLKNHFEIRFSGKASNLGTVSDYKEMINRLCPESGDWDEDSYSSYIDYSEVRDLAKKMVKTGNLQEVMKIYQAITEVIHERMEYGDDYIGSSEYEFEEALEKFAKCINKCKFKFEDKKKYIIYFFDKYYKEHTDNFSKYYINSLKKICRKKQELRYWKELLQPYIPDSLEYNDGSYDLYLKTERVFMMIDILSKLNLKKEYRELLEKFSLQDVDICFLYVKLLEENDIEDAAAFAEKGILIFKEKNTEELERFLLKYYKKKNPEKYKLCLYKMFVQGGAWTDFKKLKKEYKEPEWGKIILRIIRDLSQEGDKNSIIRIYISEKRFREGLEVALTFVYLSKFDQQFGNFVKRYPEEYFNHYKKLLIIFSDDGMGRKYYRKIVFFLKRLKTIPGLEKEFNEFIKFLREKYANRPAFLDEIKRL